MPVSYFGHCGALCSNDPPRKTTSSNTSYLAKMLVQSWISARSTLTYFKGTQSSEPDLHESGLFQCSWQPQQQAPLFLPSLKRSTHCPHPTRSTV